MSLIGFALTDDIILSSPVGPIILGILCFLVIPIGVSYNNK